MARIFTWAAICHAGLLVVVLVLGLEARRARRDPPTGGPSAPVFPPPAAATSTGAEAILPASSAAAALSLHIALAVFALLVACLIHTAVFTYFTVTGKLIQQALALGRFDVPAGMAPVKRRKAWITRMVAASIVPIVLSVGTGAWAIGGVPQQRWHLAAAILVTLAHGLVYPEYYRRIVQNGRHLDEVMRSYQERKVAQLQDAAPGA